MLKPEDIQVSHINWNHPIAESLAFVPISIEPSPQELSQNLSDAYVHFVNQHNFVNEPNRFYHLFQLAKDDKTAKSLIRN